jgi:hypothetical protein
LVRTSFRASRHIKEPRSDRHPVVVIAAKDIAAILVKAELGTRDAVRQWLFAEFSVGTIEP